MKKQSGGITLISLVVTIIILLILAGISIAQLTGRGLFENARLAKEKSDEAQEKEEGILADYENKIGEYISSNREYNSRTKLLERITATVGQEYELKDSIQNYEYIEIYAGIITGPQDIGWNSAGIHVENIVYYNDENNYRTHLSVDVFAATQAYRVPVIGFTNENTVKLLAMNAEGWTYASTDTCELIIYGY